MEFSLPISSSSVQRMACDCSVTRVLLRQDSVTIDVGRSRWVVSSTLRKAQGPRRPLPLAGLRAAGVLV